MNKASRFLLPRLSDGLPRGAPHPALSRAGAARRARLHRSAAGGKRRSSVLLVTDASVRALGLTGGLEAALKAASVACAVYDKTVPNPTIANIEEGRALYLSAHAQAIIAVGGGSVMDCAKIIGARIAEAASAGAAHGRPAAHPQAHAAAHRRADHRRNGQRNDLAAVITDSAAHHKYPINDFALIRITPCSTRS